MSSTAIVPSSSAQTLAQSNAGSTQVRNPTPQRGNAAVAASTIVSNTPKRLGQHGWIHPRMDEVISRRNKTNFDASNMKTIFVSVCMVLGTLFAPNALYQTLPTPWLYSVQPYLPWVLWSIRFAFTACIGMSTAPLLRTPDACEDIPLTPSQRQLLGLPPMSRPATPLEKEQYTTPPRFSRSNTPRSSTSSLRAEASGSPLSGRGTPLDGSTFPISGSGSPFGSQQRGSQSPMGLNGLRSGEERRRLSYTSNRSSPLSLSEFESIGSTGTPTKGGNRTSVGLNNKWLYEKGKTGSPKLYASRGPSFI